LCDENVYRCLENEALLKNRNVYARLLFETITNMRKLDGPFRRLPPSIGEELKILPLHEVRRIE